MIHRNRLLTVTRAVETLWKSSVAVTQKRQTQHRGYKSPFYYQQYQGEHDDSLEQGQYRHPQRQYDNVPATQTNSITDISSSPEEMNIFGILDITNVRDTMQSNPQEKDSEENETKRKRHRDLFNKWNKKHKIMLSWTKFYNKYHDTTGDIPEPDDMGELQLETKLFSCLMTGKSLDTIIAECNKTIEENNGVIEGNNGVIEQNNKALATNNEKLEVKQININNANISANYELINANSKTTSSTTITSDDHIENNSHNQISPFVAQNTTLMNANADIVKRNADIEKQKADIVKQNTALKDQVIQLKRTIDLMQCLQKVKPVSHNYRFTQSFSFGMVGRSNEFLEVMHQLVRGMGTAVKEDNRPIAILSAPRHGKSLLLQAVLEALRPPPTARDLPLVELFGASMPEIPKDVMVFALSLNGKTEIEAKYKANGRTAAAYLWSCVLGTEPDSDYVDNGELAAWVLNRLFPGKQIVLLIDELTNLTDTFLDDQEELKLLANNILSFFGEHTTMVFTGFDAALTMSFVSVSGRRPRIVPLAPINPNSPDFMTFMPMRTLLTDLYIREEDKKSDLLLLYELGKSTPGVLGAVAEQEYDNIPIIDILNRNNNFRNDVIWLMEEYVKVIAEGGNVVASEWLGTQLLKKKIGALWFGRTREIKKMLVYIPPIFSYAAMRQHTPNSEFHRAFNTVIAVLECWFEFLHKHRNDTDNRIRQYWAQSGGLLYELFVLAALRMQDVVLLKGLSYAIAPARLPRGSRYPAEQGVTVEGTWLTAEGTQSVDIVRSLGGGRQQWIEIKNRSARIDTETIKTLVSGVKKHLGNVSKDITEVEYIVVTHIPSSTVMHKQVSKIDIMKAMREQLPAAEEKHFSDGRRVRLTYRIVFVGTAEAARFLSPLVASIAPNTGALQGDTCEKRLLIQSLNDPCWLSLKSKEEIEQLVLDKKSLERHTPVLIQCEAAARDAERLHRELY